MRIRLGLIVAFGIVMISRVAYAPPAPSPRRMPGDEIGEAHARWIAPYVSVITHRLGESSIDSVTWFTPEGKIRRQISGPFVNVQPGFVIEGSETLPTIIHATNGDWEITLPKREGDNGYTASTADSRLFIHQFDSGPGRFSVDVYLSGRLANTIGPFFGYKGRSVQLGPDGSMAFLAWKSESRAVAQVVVIGPDGKEAFRADCDGSPTSAYPSPGGTAALIEPDFSDASGPLYSLFDATGHVSSMKIGPNANLTGWVPGTAIAVMQTSIGHAKRWHLIDWYAGKRLWEVADPNTAPVEWWGYTASIVLKDHLLLSSRQYASWADQKVPVRIVHAVSIANGKIVATWQPDPAQQPSMEAGEFLQLDGQVYLIAPDLVSRIRLEDIAGRKNGWK